MNSRPRKSASTTRFLDSFRQIPAELRALPQWVCSDANGRPIDPATGHNAKSNDPRTWGTFDAALAGCATYGHAYPAFALTAADPYCIVDLDDKEAKPASAATLALFDHIIEVLDSYTERSRGGRGFRVVVTSQLAAPLKTAHVEIYDRNHFMTFTGNADGVPKVIRDAQECIEAVVQAVRPAASKQASLPLALDAEELDSVVLARAEASAFAGARFAALHAGDWREHYASQSEADLAYVGMLWNSCGHGNQVERLWLASELAQRDKGQRPDYVAGLIAKVMQSPPKLYRDDDPASLFSDIANAHRVVRYMGSDLLYVPGIGWHVWDGARWCCDPLEARRHAGKIGRHVLREAIEIADQAARTSDRAQSDRERTLAESLMKFAGQAENVPKIEAALKAAEPLLRCDPDKLDADPWLLGCTNGVVDLRTGLLSRADPSQLITKSTGVAYDPKATAPTWTTFLARIFKQHAELPSFMQWLAGYWLTGLTDPPYLAFLYGTGANGKSTLVSAIQHAMGEYAGVGARGMLVKKYGEQHTTDIAALQGKRFVVASESAEGAKLDEDKVKALTGSDAITARYMRENNFTFTPTFKLAMQTNHKPSIPGMDEGIWRRILLIPFDEMIPEAQRDLLLRDKLRSEAPGILRWAVDGAGMFANDMTRKLPKVVADATRAYRTESDVLGEFILGECTEQPKSTVLSAVLFGSYERWCNINRETPLTHRAFGLRLRERGYASGKDRRGQRQWKGIELQASTKHAR